MLVQEVKQKLFNKLIKKEKRMTRKLTVTSEYEPFSASGVNRILFFKKILEYKMFCWNIIYGYNNARVKINPSM